MGLFGANLSDASMLERLSAHRMLGSVPVPELQWLAAHGTLKHLPTDAVLTSKNEVVEGLHIVLSGHLEIYVDGPTGRHKLMEWRGGDVTGVMPYSRITSPPGDAFATEPSDVLTVVRSEMDEMIRQCPQTTGILVHAMLDRARAFTSSYLHDEKLVSLGKLSAGLAHELNNPASAIARNASALAANADHADAAARALGSAGLSAEQLATVEKVHCACVGGTGDSVLSPLEQEEHEDAIATWLKKNGADVEIAEALADANVDLETLNDLAGTIKGSALNAALRWVAAGCATRRMTAEIQESATRIHDLVAAIKGFTQMDRAGVAEPVDIGQGLANTVAVLRSKAKGKSVGLSIDVEKDLPRVNGYGGELNQVWTNLIDNALDAVTERGRVELTAKRENGSVVVRVIDDGPGVPAEIRERIFEPFFTTKDVGKGTGLGLDIVRRLVQRHNGQIELDSRPGRSEFRVRLPIAASNAGSKGSAS